VRGRHHAFASRKDVAFLYKAVSNITAERKKEAKNEGGRLVRYSPLLASFGKGGFPAITSITASTKSKGRPRGRTG